MITRTVYLLSTLLISSLIASCSNADKTTAKKVPLYDNYVIEKKLESVDRITSFSFQGWRSLDNYYLIISTSLSKSYLIQLNSYCADLQFANAIIINNNGNSLHAKFDSIHVAKGLSGKRSGIKCIIKSIHKISREQEDEIAQLGKTKD